MKQWLILNVNQRAFMFVTATLQEHAFIQAEKETSVFIGSSVKAIAFDDPSFQNNMGLLETGFAFFGNVLYVEPMFRTMKIEEFRYLVKDNCSITWAECETKEGADKIVEALIEMEKRKEKK